MQLTMKDLELIGMVRAAHRREKVTRVLLLIWSLACAALAYLNVLPLDFFAYVMMATVFLAILLPKGSLDLGRLADLLERVEAGSDLPERDELVDALGRK